MPARPLTLDQMKRVVERRGGDIPRVPMFWHKFYNQGTIDKYGQALRDLSGSIVDDCISLYYLAPGDFEAPEGAPSDYKWAIEPKPPDYDRRGYTSRQVVSSTELIDKFVGAMPDPSNPAYYAGAREAAQKNPNRHCVGWDFFCLFERAWFLFGMEQILCETLLNPRRMKRLLRAFTDYHKKAMTGLAAAGAHAYFTSDDLGGQTTLLMSHKVLRELFFPFYEELVDHCHRVGMSFWFHCDGAVDSIFDDFIALGMDVQHPIQAGPMDQAATAKKYGGKITFLAGLDVQDLLPRGTVDDVVAGTKRLIDTFDTEEGGCIVAASNGIMPETPLENIEAFLKTAEAYGAERRRRYR